MIICYWAKFSNCIFTLESWILLSEILSGVEFDIPISLEKIWIVVIVRVQNFIFEKLPIWFVSFFYRVLMCEIYLHLSNFIIFLQLIRQISNSQNNQLDISTKLILKPVYWDAKLSLRLKYFIVEIIEWIILRIWILMKGIFEQVLIFVIDFYENVDYQK